MGSRISGILGDRKIRASGDSKTGRFSVKKVEGVLPKMTKMGPIIDQRIDRNGVGVLRKQRHVRSKNWPSTPPPPAVPPPLVDLKSLSHIS